QGYNAWQTGGIQVAQNAVQNGGNQNGLVVVSGIANQNGTGNVVAARAEGTGNKNQARCYNCRELGHIARNCTARPRRRDVVYLQTQLLIAQKEEAGIQLQAEEIDFMAAADGSAEVVQIFLWCVDSCCFKHMTGNIKLLINFVWKFLGTVRFGNDHIAAILGYGDLKWGNITIIWVYFVEGLGRNLFSVGQFCDANLEVAFKRNTCFIRDLDGVDLLKGNRSTNLYTINLYDMASASPICLMARATPTKSVGITHETSAAKTPQQNGVVERRNRMLVKAARTMLIFSHASLFLWTEAIATACYTQNRSIIHLRFNKTPYELIQGRKPNISYLYVFGALCYSKNDRENIGKLGEKGDIGFFIGYSTNSVSYRVYNRRIKKIMETVNVTFDELLAMAFEQNSSRPGLQSMTSGKISSELELTYAPSTITPQRPSE
nr:putative RNA-directed DNA polymerase [Tanacetum cinerariifolium]